MRLPNTIQNMFTVHLTWPYTDIVYEINHYKDYRNILLKEVSMFSSVEQGRGATDSDEFRLLHRLYNVRHAVPSHVSPPHVLQVRRLNTEWQASFMLARHPLLFRTT